MFSRKYSVFLFILGIFISLLFVFVPGRNEEIPRAQALQGCPNRCVIKVCVDWDAPGENGCTATPPDKGCCRPENYEDRCDPSCDPPDPDRPPTVSSALSCSAWGSNDWCIGTETLDITASESKGRALQIYGNVLGLDFACFNGGTSPTPASCSYPLPEGNAIASFAATSTINLTTGGTQAWKRDVTTPQLNRSFSESSNGYDWFKKAVKLTASASDSLSGIASIEYSYDNANWSPYVSPLNFSDGSLTVYLRATDQAGNATSYSETVQVDSQAPQLSKILTGTAGNTPWYVSDVQVEFFQTDPAPSSGIQYFSYTLDGASWVPYTSALTLEEGIHTLQVKVVDYADNSDDSVDEIKVDTSPPSVGGDRDQTPNTLGWFKKSVNLTATASDSTSGVASFQYSYDNISWTDYTTALHFVDGITTVYFQAEDIAGNQHRSDYEIKVDTQLPEVSHQISGTLGENGWYTSNVQVAVSESDPAPSSGIQSFKTSLDGVNWTDYTAPLDFVEGTYVLQMRVIDNADNRDVDGIALNVDTTAPSIQGTITGDFGENNFYNAAIEASVSVSDETSGIARTEYSLDGSAWLLYPGPLTIDDGFHKLQFRTQDVAGNYAYTEVYEFEVDTRGPNIKLPSRWYIWETGDLFVKDETSKIRNVTYEIRDGQNRWKKVERNWDPNRHEFTRDLDWNRIFGDGVRAPIGTYWVTIYAEDYAGNTSEKSAQIIIPGVNATLLPTFTPTPLPTNTPFPTEPADDNPTTMLPTVTSTPFVFAEVAPPPVDNGDDTPSTFGDSPQRPKEPLGANDLLAITAAAVTGAYIATQRKRETATTGDEKVAEDAVASDGVLQGSAAAAAIAAFKAQNEERMRREEEAQQRAAARQARERGADGKDSAARRRAEKEGRLAAFLRDRRKSREAAKRAEADRIRQKDEKKRAEKKREQSGLTGKELREKEAQQAIWDANGRAIYDANQEFEEANGFQMDAVTREQAIKDATVGGVFNAGLYATNLQASAQQKKDDDPYADMEDYYESQDRINAEMIAEAREYQLKLARERNELLNPPYIQPSPDMPLSPVEPSRYPPVPGLPVFHEIPLMCSYPLPPSEESTFFTEIAYSLDFFSIIEGIDDAVVLASKHAKWGFTWARAVNPAPGLDALLGTASQFFQDIDRFDLTPPQRIARPLIVGVESWGTGILSDTLAGGAFLAGEYFGAGVGGFVAAPVVGVGSSILMDAVVVPEINEWLFDELNLGTP